jgi:excisionase family DNA binding protein
MARASFAFTRSDGGAGLPSGDPVPSTGEERSSTVPQFDPLRERSPFPTPWLTYREAAAYCGWSVGYLRNLVSAGQVPVYGKPRLRRFRRDMLDLFLTDPDAAMRSFRAERNAHGS